MPQKPLGKSKKQGKQVSAKRISEQKQKTKKGASGELAPGGPLPAAGGCTGGAAATRLLPVLLQCDESRQMLLTQWFRNIHCTS